jgi:hypothetical protein
MPTLKVVQRQVSSPSFLLPPFCPSSLLSFLPSVLPPFLPSRRIHNYVLVAGLNFSFLLLVVIMATVPLLPPPFLGSTIVHTDPKSA